MAGEMFPCKKRRGHHYLEPSDVAADSETVKREVKTQLNFLLIIETVRRLKIHSNVKISTFNLTV